MTEDLKVETMLVEHIAQNPGQSFLTIAIHFKNTHSFNRIVGSLAHLVVKRTVRHVSIFDKKGYYINKRTITNDTKINH